MTPNLLDQAYHLEHSGVPFVLATVVRAERPTSAKPGARGIVTSDGQLTGWVGGSCAEPTVIREARRALRDGEPRLLRLCPPERLTNRQEPGVVETVLTCVSGGTLEIYLEPHLAQPQLIVISHQPVGQALAAFGAGVGFAVTVAGVDAQPALFAAASRVYSDLPFDALTVTPNSYIVVASHGNYDEDALEWALRSEAAYVALIASPRRAESVRAYLRESGLTDAQLARLKAPAGLNLGAVTPEEIALSVLAEMVQVRRKMIGDGRPTTEGRRPPEGHQAGQPDEGRKAKDDQPEPPMTPGGAEKERLQIGASAPAQPAPHAPHAPHPPEAHEFMQHAQHEHGEPAHDHRGHEAHAHAGHTPAAHESAAPEPPPPHPDEPPTAIDPVCGMTVEITGARYTAEYNGQMYYFCCPGCRRSFTKDPAKYLAEP